MVRNGSVVLCRRYQEMSFGPWLLRGVETRSSKNWLPVAELRDALMKVLAPSREVGCVKNGF